MAQRRWTDAQIQAAYDQVGTKRGAAALLGIDYSSYRKRLRRIQEGRTQDSLIESPDLPPPEILRGRSVLRNPATGETKLEWIKTSVDDEQRMAAMRAAVEAMSSEIRPVDTVQPPEHGQDDLLNLFVLTDLHIGMLAWHEETGADWNHEIAERTLEAYIAEAIRRAPSARHAVLAQIGDLLHADSLLALTPTSKHVLDVSGRYQQVVRSAVSVVVRIVDRLRREYDHLSIIWCEGNHDPAGTVWMREMLAQLYSAEPRVSVDCSPKPYYCIEHGAVSLFFHHGHLAKLTDLDRIMASEFRDVFGRTQHSYAHMGHLHHRESKESSLMIVERHRTLASRDAHSSRAGYRSGREAQCITYHRDHGEVGRVVVTPEMLAV